MPDFSDCQRGYANLWRDASVDAPRVIEIDRTVEKIRAHKDRYQAAEAATGVPWFWIACVHYRESGLDFSGVLHNGERIIGTGAKTKLRPAGRGPFATWEESVTDVLVAMRKMDRIGTWSVERCLYEFELFNGLGYFGVREMSPYLWAGTTLSDETGKFVRDGVYDAAAPEKQLGCAALLKRLIVLDPDVERALSGEAETPAPADTPAEEKPLGSYSNDALIAELAGRPGIVEVTVIYSNAAQRG